MGTRRHWVGAIALAAALLGCAHPSNHAPHPSGPDIARSDWAQATSVSATGDARWAHQVFTGRQPTRYTPGVQAGRPALHAQSESGNSAVRLRLEPAMQGFERLSFSWWVPALNTAANMADADVDDAVVRVILSFDGDLTHWSARDHMLSELSQLLTGEPLPYATLMYVWDAQQPVGTVVPNPHTRRIRKLVVESGPARLGQWIDFDRDIRADFTAAFGETPGALTGVGVMTDSNNTKASVQAWYGPLRLKPLAP